MIISPVSLICLKSQLIPISIRPVSQCSMKLLGSGLNQGIFLEIKQVENIVIIIITSYHCNKILLKCFITFPGRLLSVVKTSNSNKNSFQNENRNSSYENFDEYCNWWSNLKVFILLYERMVFYLFVFSLTILIILLCFLRKHYSALWRFNYRLILNGLKNALTIYQPLLRFCCPWLYRSSIVAV